MARLNVGWLIDNGGVGRSSCWLSSWAFVNSVKLEYFCFLTGCVLKHEQRSSASMRCHQAFVLDAFSLRSRYRLMMRRRNCVTSVRA